MFLQLLINFVCSASIILKLSTPCILVVNFFFVFQANAQNIFNICAFSGNKKKKVTVRMHGVTSFEMTESYVIYLQSMIEFTE